MINEEFFPFFFLSASGILSHWIEWYFQWSWIAGAKSKKDSIVVEIVGANNLSECIGLLPKGKR